MAGIVKGFRRAQTLPGLWVPEHPPFTLLSDSPRSQQLSVSLPVPVDEFALKGGAGTAWGRVRHDTSGSGGYRI